MMNDCVDRPTFWYEEYYAVVLSSKALSEDVKPSGTPRLAGVYIKTEKFIAIHAITQMVLYKRAIFPSVQSPE